MRIAIGIVSLFPGGGLQRDCIKIARIIYQFGHTVVLYTATPSGDVGAGSPTFPSLFFRTPQRPIMAGNTNLPSISSVRPQKRLIWWSASTSFSHGTCFTGADWSFRHRFIKQPYLRLLPRYRTYGKMEGNSFGPGQKTQIILLSQKQALEYRGVWHTEPERVIELAPTLSFERRKTEYRLNGVREQVRAQWGLQGNECVWLTIGVQPRTKGLDRVLHALHRFPHARLLIAGLNETDRVANADAELAQRLGISSRVIWLGHREDVAQIIAASDILMHPARYDTTGTVILEALVNGLPVLTTSVCGYAEHVRAAGGGIVLEEPFDSNRSWRPSGTRASLRTVPPTRKPASRMGRTNTCIRAGCKLPRSCLTSRNASSMSGTSSPPHCRIMSARRPSPGGPDGHMIGCCGRPIHYANRRSFPS